MAELVADARLPIFDGKIGRGALPFLPQLGQCRPYIQVLSKVVLMTTRNETGIKSRGVRCAMYSRSWTPALLCMILFAMQSTASNAETIGVAASIKPQAEVGVGENLRAL